MEQIIAFLIGPIVSWLQGDTLSGYFKNKKTEKRVKYGLSVLTCVVCGALLHYGDYVVYGEFQWESLLANIGIMFATSQTYYNSYFKLKK